MALPRERRLRCARRIVAALRRGRQASESIGRLHALARGDEGPTQLACVFPRRLGGAVRRNRGRRRVHAAFGALAPRLKVGWDLVFRAAAGLDRREFAELRAELERLLEQVGGVREPADDGPGPDRAGGAGED